MTTSYQTNDRGDKKSSDYLPTMDELPVSIEPETIPDDEQTFTEFFAADKLTVAARKKASVFAAAFNAVLRRSGVIEVCNKLGYDQNEIMRLYLTLIEAAQRAEYFAEEDGVPCSQHRRFKCGMYQLEEFYKRKTIPSELREKGREDEKKRYVDTLSRNARRRWSRVHSVQRELHLGLFVREAGEASDNKKTPGHFTDRLTDVITHTARLAAKRGEPVNRYNRAADEALEHFRATTAPYAPEWKTENGNEGKAPTKSGPKADGDAWKPIRSAIKKSVREATEIIRAQNLSEAEAEARRMELHALIETEWTSSPTPKGKATRATLPSLSPVTVNADTPKNEPVSATSESDLDRTPVSYLNSDEPADLLGKTHFPADENCQKTDTAADQAAATVEAFQSVGATRFKVVFLNAKPVSGQSACVGSEEVSAANLLAKVESYIKRSEQQSESVCLRPQDGALIQIDDSDASTLALLQPFSFLTIETSPGNFQAWIALHPDTNEDKRREIRDRLLRRLKETGANGGAFNSVRLPGALNAKEKYRASMGEYPRVKLVRVMRGRFVTQIELEHAGLLAAVEVKPIVKTPQRYTSANLPDRFPDFNEYLGKKWLESESRPDRSSAEIAWSCAALRKGFPEYAVADELRRVSLKAQGRRDNYVEKTVAAAASWLATQPQTDQRGARERMVV